MIAKVLVRFELKKFPTACFGNKQALIVNELDLLRSLGDHV